MRPLKLGVGHLTISTPTLRRPSRWRAICAGGSAPAGRSPATDLAAALAAADGLINTTPVGMAKIPGMPVPAALLRPELWVAEIIYFPLETELLRERPRHRLPDAARRRHGGFQAVEAFRLITGVTPDAERMLRHFASFGGK